MMKALVSTAGLSHVDWLKYRRMGLGGSDASVVCGVNRYKSPIELWMEKTGQSGNQEAGESAYWGNQLEPLVRDEFTKRTGIEVIQVNQILQSKEYPYMLANVDGVCRCPTHGRCIFEAKTASIYLSDKWDGDLVPREYVLQVQHYLAVTGYSGAYIAVLIGGQDFKWKYVPRDEETITMLIRIESDFWSRVLDDIPPDPDGSNACSEFLSKRYPKSISSSRIELPASAEDIIRQYSEASEQLEQLTEQKQQAANLLKEMLGTNEVDTVGDNLVRWQMVSQTRFDSKTFQDEQPALYEQYTVKSTYRRMSVKAAKSVANPNEHNITQEQLRKAG